MLSPSRISKINPGQSTDGGLPLAVHDGDALAADQLVLIHGRDAHSITLPSAISTTRSQASATVGECVIRTTADWIGVPQPAQGLEDDLLVGGIELAGRLVGEDDSGSPGGGGGDRHALLLAAGEPIRSVVRSLLEAEDGQRLARPPRRIAIQISARLTAAATFSRADRVGQRLSDWKTTAISLPRIRASSFSSSRASERPSILTSPAEGTSIAAARESMVLLPDPEGPTTATVSRGSTFRFRPRSATVSVEPARKILKTSISSRPGGSASSPGCSGST